MGDGYECGYGYGYVMDGWMDGWIMAAGKVALVSGLAVSGGGEAGEWGVDKEGMIPATPSGF